MIDKHFLQSFLKVNNASENMSDSEVRDVLARAGWAQSEIEAALALLRSNAALGVGTAQLSGASAALNPTFEVSSQQLSSLLGVDVEVDPSKLRRGYGYPVRHGDFHIKDMMLKSVLGISIVLFSLAMTAALGWFFMYFLQIGPYR